MIKQDLKSQTQQLVKIRLLSLISLPARGSFNIPGLNSDLGCGRVIHTQHQTIFRHLKGLQEFKSIMTLLGDNIRSHRIEFQLYKTALIPHFR